MVTMTVSQYGTIRVCYGGDEVRVIDYDTNNRQWRAWFNRYQRRGNAHIIGENRYGAIVHVYGELEQ
jgi:hypothetical protein